MMLVGIRLKVVTCFYLLTILICLSSCSDKEELPTLILDDRYMRSVDFDAIGVSIPIHQQSYYLRSDGIVDNIEIHQKKILEEIGITDRNFSYSNPARNGRAMPLRFAGGKLCVFVWAKRHSDTKISNARLEHEKYHALIRLNPKGVDVLSSAMEQHGFGVDLKALDEETAATVIEILSIHLLGIELDDIKGSEYVTKAVRILKESRNKESP